ncbi:mrpl-9 [Pristionchus pacificus]|uniref:Large ribosomal subunit protein bL9m n=1 Tax=Pristionchus pacificus TaxID=54126 RepID=A0A2A6CCE1_PRIPA|nr:mrpl-9 [Pristionchus pacificus]|eukprot:PDM75799.1 mrpl-9 [Pristionchus pacificus]
MLPACSRALIRSAERLCQAATASQTLSRNTWVLQRVHAAPVTPAGLPQRDPSEIRELERYEVVDYETSKAAGPLKVILLEDVEGVGHQFDVVEVDRKRARTDLLLGKKAVYASPFDLKYYADMKEKMREELAARVRIPYELLTVSRELVKLVVPLRVNMENKWKLDRRIVKTSLRQVGVDLLDDAIFLSDASASINGPNFDLEAKLVRFYVVVSQQYIIPMLGRIAHISADDSKQVLAPEKLKQPTAADLAKHGLLPEEPYYHKSSEIDNEFDVATFMRNRAGQQK